MIRNCSPQLLHPQTYYSTLSLQLQRSVGMKSLCFLLSQVLLLALSLADATTEVHLDVPASLSLSNTALMVRVERKVDINYRYILVGNGQWTQYPDMHMILDLPFSQYVKVYYNIQIAINGNGWINTRVMIDGVQNNLLRRGAGLLNYPSVYMDTEVFLQKGKHTIHLQYKCNCNIAQQPSWDWGSDIFQVSYYRPINQ